MRDCRAVTPLPSEIVTSPAIPELLHYSGYVLHQCESDVTRSLSLQPGVQTSGVTLFSCWENDISEKWMRGKENHYIELSTKYVQYMTNFKSELNEKRSQSMMSAEVYLASA